LEEKMLLPFSTLVLTSQLIIAVADNVPKFNIEQGCKIDGTASSLDVGLNESTKRCVQDEQQAPGSTSNAMVAICLIGPGNVYQCNYSRRRRAAELCRITDMSPGPIARKEARQKMSIIVATR
jgi:hypothetical protein